MFFLSYSSADEIKFIQKFFEDLGNKVAGLLPEGESYPPFLDRRSIRTGDDWEREIKDGLVKAKVLICVYPPRYFMRHGKGPNFCAREVLAFVKRHRQIRFEEEKGERVIRESNVLIPIFWCGKSDLEALDLPPASQIYSVLIVRHR